MFQIPIRNKTTGEEKSFFGLSAIAEFLMDRDDAADWTGWEFAGKLPEFGPVIAKVEAEPADEVPAEALETSETAPETSAETPAEVESDSTHDAPFISQEPASDA